MGKIISLKDYRDKESQNYKKEKNTSKYSLALQKATKEEFLLTIE
ncbi:hypothetical protein [Clostridium botulinum]|nr:hypothetical protein [Clostridium botulinum]APH20987.1 hypothetical protein NPD1_4279 [Clostridium botulinum]APQ71267.1 hypothetical protein RSJ8_4236 [Clostridium botulinum]